jgi:hypothetical protein
LVDHELRFITVLSDIHGVLLGFQTLLNKTGHRFIVFSYEDTHRLTLILIVTARSETRPGAGLASLLNDSPSLTTTYFGGTDLKVEEISAKAPFNECRVSEQWQLRRQCRSNLIGLDVGACSCLRSQRDSTTAGEIVGTARAIGPQLAGGEENNP